MTNEQSVSNNDLLKELLSTVKDLQTVAVLKRGATSGSSSHLLMATLSQNDSAICGKDPPTKRARSEEGKISEEDPPSREEDNDDTRRRVVPSLKLPSRLSLTQLPRRKKMAKLGTPDCRWTKLPELDCFIVSTIPKEIVHNDNAAQKTQRLWFEASAVLAVIVDKSDTAAISDSEIIQGIRNTILLLGNASQQHSLQQMKTILQYLSPQLKSLVLDADFAKAPPYCSGLTLVNLQRRGWKPQYSFRKQLKKLLKIFRSATQKFTSGLMYSSVNTPSEPCSTFPGVDRQAKSDRMSVSHKKSSSSSAQLEYTNTRQSGPANSTRVYDRPNRDPPTNLLAPTNSYITRQSCSGDTGSSRTDQERGNSQDNSLSKQLHLPAIPGREKKRGGGNNQSST